MNYLLIFITESILYHYLSPVNTRPPLEESTPCESTNQLQILQILVLFVDL